MSDIEFGYTIWNVGDPEYVHPGAFTRLARAVEAHGFDSVWAQDHVALPRDIPDEYPFTEDGVCPVGSTDHVYSPFETLAYLAGVTDDITLGTDVCIAAYRHPVVLAKQVLTLDALTDGGFDLGVGAGWMRTEFDLVDVPFEERGARLDEFLELLGRACEEGELAFDGPHHSFQQTGFYPVPTDRQLPRTWVGGRSGATIRRIAEYGHGWTSFWETPEDVAAFRERMLRAWDDFDRSGEPGVAVGRPVHVGQDGPSDDRLLVGDPDDVIADVQRYVDAGTTRLDVTTYTTDLDAQREQVERFGEEVLSSF
jgi:probable F420-dependent oxidoreductase